jgi:hypothetical protein
MLALEPVWVDVNVPTRHHAHDWTIDIQPVKELAQYRQIPHSGDPFSQLTFSSHHCRQRAAPRWRDQAQQAGRGRSSSTDGEGIEKQGRASGRHWIAGRGSSPKPGQSIATVVKFEASRS